MAHFTSREIDPDTEREETAFREKVRDILGLTPDVREIAVLAELKRLKREREAFTIQVLKNSGVDTECGACMEVAFTGVTQAAHSCQP